MTDGRTRHYGTFYGLSAPSPDRPVLVVYGNCQAESIRILLDAAVGEALQTVRIPPVFELTRADLPFLAALLGRTTLLISQPVSQDYRDLPLGTRQVTALMPTGAQVLRWPVLRYSGTLPFQAIVRDPLDPSADPPGVPYHDLRTLASAWSGSDLFAVPVDPDAVRAIGAASRAELARREARDADLTASDLLDPPQQGDWATINHPGNRILQAVATRILAGLGLAGSVADPGRVLLGEVVSPADPRVDAAVGLVGPGDARRSAPTGAWRVGPGTVPSETIHRMQWDWYRDRPQVVRAGRERHADTLARLGLA